MGFMEKRGEDFYNMARFDCLIRSGSSFSRAVHLFGKFQIVIYPKQLKLYGAKLVVDEAGIIDYRNDLFETVDYKAVT